MRKQLAKTTIAMSILLTGISPAGTVLASTKINKSPTENQLPNTPQMRDTPASNIDTVNPELSRQLKTKKAGSIKFWEAIAWCETNHNWSDGGYFSGGLGMAKSVWVNYGGRQFSPTPKTATKYEQIIIANRVSFFGFQTKNIYRTLEDKINNKPYLRPAVGWRNLKNWGKGCANWETRKPTRERYTEAGMAEWKESRIAVTKSSAGLRGGVSSQSANKKMKRCPQWERKLKAHGLPVARFSYIMWRESRCQEKVVSKPNRNGTKDYGLLQINSSWRTVTRNVCGGRNLNVLLDSSCNLRVARYLFDNGGLNHWSATSGIKS